MSKKEKAEQIFRDNYEKEFGKGMDEWIMYNTKLYGNVIIPSIVQALEIDRGITIVDSSLKLFSQKSDWTKSKFDNPTIKESLTIQPGQKLVDGDYFEGGTEEQYYDLCKSLSGISPSSQLMASALNQGVFYYRNTLALCSSEKDKKTHYSFPDFKQLCINTFSYEL